MRFNRLFNLKIRKMRIKYFKAVLIGFIALTFLMSCSEDDKNMDEVNPDRKLELRSGDEQTNLPIFGNDYLVPFEAAQVIAQKIDKTLPTELKRYSESREIQSSSTITDSLGNIYIYVFNYVDDGYIMISADERHEPIISLATKGSYQNEDVPSGLYNWLVETLEIIDGLKNGSLHNRFQAKSEWIRIIREIDDPQLNPDPIGFDCCEECPNWPDCQYDPVGCGDETVFCDNDPCGTYSTTSK
jgi:hypothetical protein